MSECRELFYKHPFQVCKQYYIFKQYYFLLIQDKQKKNDKLIENTRNNFYTLHSRSL